MTKETRSCLAFSQKLQTLVGKELHIRINNNRSTLLHVKWERTKTKVSLHQMFLEAPEPVHNALASYIRRDNRKLPVAIKAYIEEKTNSFDYSHELDPSEVCAKGDCYDLQAIFDRLNVFYFNRALDLHISWYGSGQQHYRSRCNLGLYCDMLKLIKIHRLLDCPYVPLYVIEYVVYHEMVHCVSPAYVDNDGINRMHSIEFKEIEKLFLHYRQAKEWLKINRKNFFVKERFRWLDTANGQISSIKRPKPMQKKAKSLLEYLKRLLTR